MLYDTVLFYQGPIVASLINQFGCRSVVIGGGLVTAIMYMLTIFVTNVWIMLITYGIIGGIIVFCNFSHKIYK
jgi:hypothetical protein